MIVGKNQAEKMRPQEGLHLLQTVPDASIQIGDGDVLPFKQSNTAGAGAMELDLTMIAPPPYGGGVDAKDTGDLRGSQGELPGFAV